MHAGLSLVGSVAVIAGLVNEGIQARELDPFYPSAKSILIIFLYSIVLFVLNLKQFRKIGLNVSKFDFDEVQSGNSKNFFAINDRSKAIIKALKIENLNVPVPR